MYCSNSGVAFHSCIIFPSKSFRVEIVKWKNWLKFCPNVANCVWFHTCGVLKFSKNLHFHLPERRKRNTGKWSRDCTLIFYTFSLMTTILIIFQYNFEFVSANSLTVDEATILFAWDRCYFSVAILESDEFLISHFWRRFVIFLIKFVSLLFVDEYKVSYKSCLEGFSYRYSALGNFNFQDRADSCMTLGTWKTFILSVVL